MPLVWTREGLAWRALLELARWAWLPALENRLRLPPALKAQDSPCPNWLRPAASPAGAIGLAPRLLPV